MGVHRHTQEYYQRFVRESFVNHEDEVSEERLEQITQRAREDAAWVLHKACQLPLFSEFLSPCPHPPPRLRRQVLVAAGGARCD